MQVIDYVRNCLMKVFSRSLGTRRANQVFKKQKTHADQTSRFPFTGRC